MSKLKIYDLTLTVELEGSIDHFIKTVELLGHTEVDIRTTGAYLSKNSDKVHEVQVEWPIRARSPEDAVILVKAKIYDVLKHCNEDKRG